MIYLINEIIIYNSADCTLSHIPTQETLNLSISSGRLFEQLLNSNGEILSRDRLMTEVWDNYGLRGSNSNLNQYLSILRRALAGFDCENLIITVPKLGIRLNTDIPIEYQEAGQMTASESGSDVQCEPAFSGLMPTAPSEFKAESISSKPQPAPDEALASPRHWILLALLFISMCSVLGWSYLNIRKGAEEFTQRVTLNLAGGCQAVIIQGVGNSEQQMLENQLLQILKKNHQACDTDLRLYVSKNTSFSTRSYGRTMLSSCKLNSRRHVISCNNFYYIDWRME